MPLIRLLRTLAALLVLATVALLGRLTLGAVDDLRRAGTGLETIERLRLALKVEEMASRERGPTNGLLGDDLPHTPAYVKALGDARQRTDLAFAALLHRAADQRSIVEPARAAQAALEEARANVDRLVGVPRAARPPERIGAAVHAMVAVIPMLAPGVTRLASDAQAAYPQAGDDVQAALLAAELREYAGLLGSHFTAALAKQQALTHAEHEAVGRTQGRIEELQFLIGVRVAAEDEPVAIARAWDAVRARYFGRALQLASGVIEASDHGASYGLDPAQFAARYVPDMNAILDLRDALLEHARASAVQAHDASGRTLATVVAGGALLVAVLLLVFAVLQRRILAPLATIASAVHALARNQTAIELPRARADDEMAAVIGAVESMRERQQQRLALERERDELIERLRDQSNTDALTGLANRRGFFEAAEHVLALARRHDFGVVAIVLDIDHFKRINDQLGHAAGDAVLFAVAEAIRGEMRDSDLAGRLGGEEFALLLGHCELEQGMVFAERLRRAIQAIVAPGESAERGQFTTASLGVALFGPHSPTLDTLLGHADAAMYRAKSTGRNRVVSADAAAQRPEQDTV